MSANNSKDVHQFFNSVNLPAAKVTLPSACLTNDSANPKLQNQLSNESVTHIISHQQIRQTEKQQVQVFIAKNLNDKKKDDIDSDATESDPEVKAIMQQSEKKKKLNEQQIRLMRNLRENQPLIETLMAKEKNAAQHRTARQKQKDTEADKENVNPKRRQRPIQASQSTSATHLNRRPSLKSVNVNSSSINSAHRSASAAVFYSLDSPDLPTVAQLENFEQDPEAALLLFHETSGAHASLIAATDELDPDYDVPLDLKTTVESMKPIDAAKTQEIIEKFQKVMDKYQVTQACASCGMRSAPGVENPITFIKIDSSAANIFLFTDAQMHELSLKSPIYKQIKSILHYDNGSTYHLHPELCDGDTIPLCHYCYRQANSGNIPQHSLASGCDFGLASRANLPKLSLLEQSLITHYSIFGHIIKLVSPSSVQKPSQKISKSLFTGHIIAFQSNAVNKLVSVFPNIDNAKASIQVSYLDPSNRPEKMMRLGFSVLSSSHLRVNITNVYTWLHHLKSSNPFYSDIVIDESQSTALKLSELPRQLCKSASIISDDVVIRMEQQAINDVSGVRINATSKPNDDIDDSADNLDTIDDLDTTDSKSDTSNTGKFSTSTLIFGLYFLKACNIHENAKKNNLTSTRFWHFLCHYC